MRVSILKRTETRKVSSPLTHGGVGALSRWRTRLPLDACVLGGRHAASPIKKALVGSGLGPFQCPEPFVLVGAQLIALRHRLRRWMLGVGPRG